jgi:hypothetical protein
MTVSSLRVEYRVCGIPPAWDSTNMEFQKTYPTEYHSAGIPREDYC